MKHMIFGESHGPAIGVVLEDVPPGLALDLEAVEREMARRAPGRDSLSTPRKEADQVEILSGLFEGKTCGTPLCAVIRNTDTRSKDYQPDLPRPGHADYAGHVRYDGCNDYRGGGHFSGRLTAPLVFAGAVAKQLLAERGVYVGAHIRSICGIEDQPFDGLHEDRALFEALAAKPFPTLSDEAGAQMQDAIRRAREDRDSIGGSIECCATGLPAGLGSPDYGRNVEGIVSQHLFAVPAVKAIAFGAGFHFASMRGSEANDPLYVEQGRVLTRTNHTGGVNGGITNGMPIWFTVAIRPTPSIAQPQETVSLSSCESATLTVKGRHDPCIVHRAVPVVEAACALAMCEILEI
ncbi:MAG: chorismate synthase [Oscillospiraceae bacterium]|nr:chorismate synthase [Oscillospiraceae bacterium]